MKIKYQEMSYKTVQYNGVYPMCEQCDLFIDNKRSCTKVPELVKAGNCCWNRYKKGRPIVFKRYDS